MKEKVRCDGEVRLYFTRSPPLFFLTLFSIFFSTFIIKSLGLVTNKKGVKHMFVFLSWHYTKKNVLGHL